MITDLIKQNKILNTILPAIQNEQVYLVGGFIRDCLLGRSSCDIDIVVPQNKGESVAKKIADYISGYFIELDSINRIYRVVFEDKVNYIDIADCVGSDIEEDLKRRDFTINALAYDLNKNCIIDVCNGLKDIENKIIREVSKNSITDDPIRILRAFRFQSELGFEISEELKSLINEHAKKLSSTAKERINTELVKMFGGKYIVETLYSLEDFKILEFIFPEVGEIRKIPPNSHHHLNLLDHSIETVKQVQYFYDQSSDEVKNHLNKIIFGAHSRIAYLKIAAFLHDVGKPATWQIEKETGRHRFIMHDTEGAKIIVPTLKALKFSKKQISYIQKIIKFHIYPACVATANEISEKAYLRFYRKLEDEVIDIIAVAYADRMSALGPDITQDIIQKNIDGLQNLLTKYLEQKQNLKPLPKLLDGKEIMGLLNIEPCAKLGKIIEKLKEAQLSSEVNTKEEAIAFIKQINL